MTSKITASNRLPELAREIDRHHEGAACSFSEGIQHVLRAGEALIEAKTLMGHGNWLEWLEANTSVSPRMSQQYMRLARAYAKLPEAKAKRVSYLSLRDAIRQISADTSRAAQLSPTVLDQATAEAQSETVPLKGAITNAMERSRTEEQRQKQNAVCEARDLITHRPPSSAEIALANALLRVIAEMAQQDPDIQPHTVKSVFDLISNGIEEIWSYPPEELQIGDSQSDKKPEVQPIAKCLKSVQQAIRTALGHVSEKEREAFFRQVRLAVNEIDDGELGDQESERGLPWQREARP